MSNTGYSPLPHDPPSYNDSLNDEEAEKQAPGTQSQQLPPTAPQQYPMQYVSQPVPGYVYPQQPVTQGGLPVQQVQYMVQPNVLAPQVVQRPGYKAPHTYFVITIVVMIICSIFNITSLAFGVPALIMAIMAQTSLSSGDYPTASTRGQTAMILTVVNAGYTLLMILIITASIVGTQCLEYNYDYICGYSVYY